MAQTFQSSFIPKAAVTEEVFKKKKAGIFGVLAVSLFITSIIVAGALYFYKGMVKSDIDALKIQLTEAEKSIDKKTIGELSDFSKKLQIAKTLVNRHKVVSNFLGILSSSTVSSVRFTEFNYTYPTDSTLSVSLMGEATSYAAVALQENVLSKNSNLKSVSFSQLRLGEGGVVSFKLDMVVDPQSSVYSP